MTQHTLTLDCDQLDTLTGQLAMVRSTTRPTTYSALIIDQANDLLAVIESQTGDPLVVGVEPATVDLVVEHLRKLGNLPPDAKIRTGDRTLALSLAATLGDLIGVDVPIAGDEPAPEPVKVRHCAGCGELTSRGKWCSEGCWDEAHDHGWDAA